jgi:hypothetical protein
MVQLNQRRQEKKLLYRNEPNEPTREGPLSYVLLESPYNQQLAGPPLSSLSGNESFKRGEGKKAFRSSSPKSKNDFVYGNIFNQELGL